MKWNSRLTAGLLTLIMLLTTLIVPAIADDVTPDHSYTYWLHAGVDNTSYYTAYQDNPGVRYSLDYKTYQVDGNDVRVDVEFWVPIAGSENDNFNTLIATDSYADVMSLGMYHGSLTELYRDGIALDLTDLVPKYMPNYYAYLQAHPEYTATNLVDGEPRILQLWSFNDDLISTYWGGWMYRRDWIVKYGKNPLDGSSFTGSYTGTMEDGSPDRKTWQDNVVFPSGGYHPVTISDWEWMFEIFTVALQDLSITDGYCMSLYYPGYLELGDIVSSFGGGSAHWYLNRDTGAYDFGGNSEHFRTYLQCMNTWYKNGWIDKAFAEHASDMFFQIDSAKVYQGKVGLWYGQISQLMGSLDDSSSPYRDGMVVFSAAQPINDKYGTEDQKNREPDCFFQPSHADTSIMITDKAAKKDLPALLSWLDYFYTPEGSRLRFFGLSKEQVEETQDPVYLALGLTEGGYYAVETEDGVKYQYVQKMIDDDQILSITTAVYMFSKGGPADWLGKAPLEQDLVEQWNLYQATGLPSNLFKSQMDADDARAFTKTETRIREFMSKNVPPFIRGEKDPFSDQDWNAFVKGLSKYGPEKNTKIYQELWEQFQ